MSEAETMPLNEGHAFEAMDRISMVLAHLSAALDDHPMMVASPELAAAIAKATDVLCDAYQIAGHLVFEQ